jgi:Ala-tRNA(Pro) deacylase
MAVTPEQLLKILDEKGFETTTEEHEAVFTVDQSRDLHVKIEGGHTKNLFVKDKKDNYFLLVIEQSAKVDLNRVHRLIGAKSRLSFGKPDKLMEYLGVSPGSVTAFSVINDSNGKVQLIIDKPLLAHEKINCHPLTNEMTTTICREDLLTFLEEVNHKPEIIQISTVVDDQMV